MVTETGLGDGSRGERNRKDLLCVELCLCSGDRGEFLNFKAPEPKNVLYIDGEMPAPAMQERLMQLKLTNPADEVRLKIITPDLQPKDQGSINQSSRPTRVMESFS